MADSIKSHLGIITGNAATWFAVVTANQIQIEWWLRNVSYCGAILVSALTIWSIVRKNCSNSRTSKKD